MHFVLLLRFDSCTACCTALNRRFLLLHFELWVWPSLSLRSHCKTLAERNETYVCACWKRAREAAHVLSLPISFGLSISLALMWCHARTIKVCCYASSRFFIVCGIKTMPKLSFHFPFSHSSSTRWATFSNTSVYFHIDDARASYLCIYIYMVYIYFVDIHAGNADLIDLNPQLITNDSSQHEFFKEIACWRCSRSGATNCGANTNTSAHHLHTQTQHTHTQQLTCRGAFSMYIEFSVSLYRIDEENEDGYGNASGIVLYKYGLYNLLPFKGII